jgi:Protein of unknown function (DUF2867)
MDVTPVACEVPKPSLVAAHLPGASFYDAWSMPVGGPPRDALGYFLLAAASTPAWVNMAMTIRNKVVLAFGLKDLGALPPLDPSLPTTAYQPGDRVGIFKLLQNTPAETLLGDNDKHLDVVVSLHVGPPLADEALDANVVTKHPSNTRVITVSTVVHVHNRLGRLYMLPVTPAHRVIVPTMLRRLASLTSAP